MTVRFRAAQGADVPAIVALLADDVLGKAREAPGDPGYDRAFTAIDGDPNQLLAVAEQDGAVVGTLQISFTPGLSNRGAWRGTVEAVRVDATHRGSGIGQQMMLWAIDQCRARGCGIVQLTTNAARVDAHRFYEKLGFTRSHFGYKLALVRSFERSSSRRTTNSGGVGAPGRT